MLETRFVSEKRNTRTAHTRRKQAADASGMVHAVIGRSREIRQRVVSVSKENQLHIKGSKTCLELVNNPLPKRNEMCSYFSRVMLAVDCLTTAKRPNPPDYLLSTRRSCSAIRLPQSRVSPGSTTPPCCLPSAST